MLLTSPLSSPLKNPVRDVFSPAGSSQSLTAQVQALFAGGKVGGMWDMGDTSTLFQEAVGATPVTAVTQPIGIVLDKSQGLVRGAEKVTGNTATFDTGVGSWIGYNSATIAAVGGELQITQNAVNGRATLRLPCTVGVVCEVSADVRSINGVGCALGVGIYGDGNGATFAYATTSATFTRQTLRMKSTDANPAFINITVGCNGGGTGIFAVDNVSFREIPGNHATQPTAGWLPLYEEDGSYGCARFDATDDALLFPAITFGGAFNTFVAGKVTSGTSGIHLWRTADVNGTWAKYKSGDATTPTGTGSGSPTYAVNGTALSPSQQGQLYTQINGVDCVVESIGVVLTAETALQLSGFVGSQFTGYAHRVLMISGTLTAGEKLLCRQWCAEGNGVTVV